jgi:hypothetical protein
MCFRTRVLLDQTLRLNLEIRTCQSNLKCSYTLWLHEYNTNYFRHFLLHCTASLTGHSTYISSHITRRSVKFYGGEIWRRTVWWTVINFSEKCADITACCPQHQIIYHEYAASWLLWKFGNHLTNCKAPFLNRKSQPWGMRILICERTNMAEVHKKLECL